MTAVTSGTEPVIGEPITRKKLLVTTKPLFSVVFDNLVDPTVVLGILRLLEVAVGLTLLGLSAKLTAILNSSPGTTDLLATDANNSTFLIDISNATDTNIAGLVTGIVTPFTHATLSSWDNLVGADSSVFVHSAAVVLAQTVNLGLWLATAIWFTVKYDHWDCSNPGKLLEQYNATETSDNGLSVFNHLAFTFYKNSTNDTLADVIGMEDTTLLTEGIDSLFQALNTEMVTISLMDTDNITVSQNIISRLSKDCSLKKGSIGVSWTGFALFVLSTVLLFTIVMSKPVQPPKSVVPFTTFTSKFTRSNLISNTSNGDEVKTSITEDLPLYKEEFPATGTAFETVITDQKKTKHVEVTIVQLEKLSNTENYNFLIHLTFPNFPKYSIDLKYAPKLAHTPTTAVQDPTDDIGTLSLVSSISANSTPFVSGLPSTISITYDCRVCLWKDEKQMVRDNLLKANPLPADSYENFDVAFGKSWSAIEAYVLRKDDGFSDFKNVTDVVGKITALKPSPNDVSGSNSSNIADAGLESLVTCLKKFCEQEWSDSDSRERGVSSTEVTDEKATNGEASTSEGGSSKPWMKAKWDELCRVGLFPAFIRLIVRVFSLIKASIGFLFNPKYHWMIVLFGDPVVKEATLGLSSLGHLSEISRIFITLVINKAVYAVSIKCDAKPVAVAANSPSNAAPVFKRANMRLLEENLRSRRGSEMSGSTSVSDTDADNLASEIENEISKIKKYKRNKAPSKRFSRAIMFP